MLTYKQRYKPRTTREYTKSDLTVYDSAGNTALNALTVYGKSEVVDGVIKSAGDSGTIEVQTCKKNLLDPTKYYQRVGYTNLIVNYTNNVIQIENITSGGRFIAWNIKTTPGERVTISWTNTNNVAGLGIINTETFVDSWAGYGYSIDSGRTITSSTEWLQVYADLQLTEQATASIAEIQVEKGSTATAYEPYNGTMATFTTGTPLYGVSDTVRDVMRWDGTSGEGTKKCNKVRLADLSWGRYETGGFAANLNDSPSGIIALICSKYPYDNSIIFNWTNFNNYNNKTLYRSTGVAIYIKDTDYNTVSDFVASLGDAELIYELATPTTEPLTQTENESLASLRTFATTTHFTNNADTDMTVNYTMRMPNT